MRRFNAEDDRKLDESGRRLRRLPKVNMPSEDFCKEKDYKYRSASCHRYFNPSKSSSYDRIKSAPDYAIKKPSYTTYQEVMAGVKNKYPWSSSSPYLWPLPTPSNDLIRVNISGERQRCEGYLTYSALPAIRRSQDDHLGNRRRDETLRLSGTLHIFPTPSANLSSTGNSNSIFQRHSGNSNNNFTSFSNNSYFSSSAKNNLGASSNNVMRKRCLVTMHYYGDPIRLSELWSYRKDEITVEQQHCGGNTLVVFRGRLAPGSDFSFPSMRRRDFPFSLTIYIEHQQNTRISVCCEAKHRKGVRLGGNNGCFGLVDVENPGYCESCTEAKKRKKMERKVKKQKKMKGTFRKEDEDDEDESKKSQDDDDDDDNEKKQKRKKLKLNNCKDDDDYEDDFENESDKDKSVPSSGKQEETKKETEVSEKSPNSVRSNESERSKSYDKIPKKKTQTFERDDKMEIEDVSKSVRIKESKQGSDKAKTTKNKHKKESETSSVDKSTRNNSSEQKSESRDKKSQKRKTPRNIGLPLVSAENKSTISAKDENESENTNNRKNDSRCDSSASRRSNKSNKESSHFSPLEAASENLENLQDNEIETTPRGGRRSVITEAGESEIEKSEMEGRADEEREEARYQSRMSGKAEAICSSGQNMEVDERDECEVADDEDDGKTEEGGVKMDDEDGNIDDEDGNMDEEDGRVDDEEKQEGTEETNEDDMAEERPSSGVDRRKKEEEYEVKLREAAMECVADVYRSLEKSMKEEIDEENPDEET